MKLWGNGKLQLSFQGVCDIISSDNDNELLQIQIPIDFWILYLGFKGSRENVETSRAEESIFSRAVLPALHVDVIEKKLMSFVLLDTYACVVKSEISY